MCDINTNFYCENKKIRYVTTIMRTGTKNGLNIFALTDCHQEARKLCCLFSEIVHRASPKGENTLICDSGDLFKGIYDRQLCVDSYLQLRQQLPKAKIVIAVGNNDFGFNTEELNFFKKVIRRFNQANIHVLCANLIDDKTGKYPDWVDPYILLEINSKKVMVLAFCINQIRLKKFGLHLLDIKQSFLSLSSQIKFIAPDALIVLNHALVPSSLSLYAAAREADINIDLIIGGHEHSPIEPKAEKHIYYPLAYTRNMLQFCLNLTQKPAQLKFIEAIDCKRCDIIDVFDAPLTDYENNTGLNVPVALSVLNLERDYSNPSPIGTFLTDKMRATANADIGLISTGFICHALRFEKGKMLTYYNIERAFSAETPLQTLVATPSDLKAVFNNAIRNRYTQYSGNTRFLQCSQNVALECVRLTDGSGAVKQIYINGEALFDDNGNPLHPQDTYICAVDPFIGAGEMGFDAFRPLAKETLLKHNKLVKIKDLFVEAIIEAEKKYTPGSSYPAFKLTDL